MTAMHDLRFALRMLWRNPGFTVVAVLSLAIGIGANTAVFSVFYALLFRDLPVERPGQLVILRKLENGTKYNPFSYPLYRMLEQNQQILQGVLGCGDLPMLRSVESGEGRWLGGVGAQSVSRSYFTVLGVGAQRGRVFAPGDTEPVVVISDGFWSREYSRRNEAVGSTVRLNGVAATIVGVAPAGFFGARVGESPDLYVPIDLVGRIVGEEYVRHPRNHWVTVLGRLRPGTGNRDVETELNRIFEQSPEYQRARSAGRDLRVVVEAGRRGLNSLKARFDRPLAVLMGFSGLLLLIACCNVANLLLARASARRREIGIRIALGAGGRRLVRQLMTESLLLSAAGGAVAIWMTGFAGPALVAFASDPRHPIAVDCGSDLGVFGFVAMVSFLTLFLFGLIPALQAVRIDVSSTLRESAGGKATGRGHHRLGKSLIVVQSALSLILLVGAGLFFRTLSNLRSVNPGFRSENVLLGLLAWELTPEGMARLVAIGPPLLERLHALPGVEACGLSTYGGLDPGHETVEVSLPDRTLETETVIRVNHVSPGYFEVYRIGRLAGRLIEATDSEGSQPVAVVNQSMARLLGGTREVLGARICLAPSFKPDAAVEIVGVVNDAKYTDLREEMQPQVFLPMRQSGTPPVYVAVRTPNASAMRGMLRQLIRELDPKVGFLRIYSLQENIEATLVQERMMARLSALFGSLSLLLACGGIYGVMAYATARRTKEIGIRMAIGAPPALVMRTVLLEAALLVAAGVAAGLPLAVVATRGLATLLYGVTPWDPATLGATVVTIGGCGLLAAYVPARRASHVDPLTAVRFD